LFQELAVQADVLITSGRYLREYDHGPNQELLQVYDDPEFEDLGNWRVEQGLSKYPAIAVVSRSLDFNVPSPLQDPGRQLFVFTTEQADQELKAKLSDQGSEVIVAGKDGVTGRALVAGLRSNGFRLVYSTAGPHILHMLLNGNVLDRLYLTIAMRTLGGKPFSSIVEGSLLDPPTNFKMHSLYLDPDGPEGSSQVYVALDRIPFGQSSS
jgi:riboflavin biosynthesis pyrimidine reductase